MDTKVKLGDILWSVHNGSLCPRETWKEKEMYPFVVTLSTYVYGTDCNGVHYVGVKPVIPFANFAVIVGCDQTSNIPPTELTTEQKHMLEACEYLKKGMLTSVVEEAQQKIFYGDGEWYYP